MQTESNWNRLTIACICLLLLPQACASVHKTASRGEEVSSAGSPSSVAKPKKAATKPYVFSWMFANHDSMRVRGGTTKGGPVAIRDMPTNSWRRLTAIDSTTSAPDRDRAAILAMAGEFRVSFDFLEAVLFAGQSNPARPYRSWATEKVYVVEDTQDLISLQHVLVMVFVDSTGEPGDPMVMKHWRQDWRYEPSTVLEYSGNREWTVREVDTRDRMGAWSQTVWHVDDSPRYGSVGRWVHTDAFSSWTGNQTLRPLPRREHSVRSDYDVLDGTNRHTIIPTGWVHEQDNLKHVQETDSVRTLSYVSREYGVNRYESADGFDWTSGDDSMRKHEPFWRRVRDEWGSRAAAHRRFTVSTTCNGKPAFFAFFDSASRTSERTDAENQAAVDRLINCVFEAKN